MVNTRMPLSKHRLQHIKQPHSTKTITLIKADNLEAISVIILQLMVAMIVA